MVYVALWVSDQDKALDFYTNVIGLEKRGDYPTPDGPRFLTVGVKGQDFELVLWPGTPGRAKPGSAVYTIEVENCRMAFETLESRGVEFEAPEILEFPWGYAARFQDPRESASGARGSRGISALKECRSSHSPFWPVIRIETESDGRARVACRTFRGAPDASPGGGLQDAGVKKDSDFNRASLSVVGSVVRSSVDFRRQWAASRACRRISARVPTPGWARVVRRAGAGASKLAYCPGTLDVRFPRKQWRDRVRQQSLDPSRSLETDISVSWAEAARSSGSPYR